MERLAQRERILGETSVQLQERIAYMKQGAAQMASGTCPVAGVPCPLGEEMDPSFLEARTAELTEELAALQEERMDVSQALAESNLTEAFLALERELTLSHGDAIGFPAFHRTQPRSPTNTRSALNGNGWRK